jgi:hypothetical protein
LQITPPSSAPLPAPKTVTSLVPRSAWASAEGHRAWIAFVIVPTQ